MKKLIIELRLFMAEKLLDWAASIAPATDAGDKIKVVVYDYIIKEVNKRRNP